MILKIIKLAFLNTPNFYKSIFGENYSNVKKKINLFDIINLLIPKLSIYCPNFLPNIIKKLFFKNDCIYIKNKNEIEDNICIIYINGILSSNDEILNDINILSSFFNRPVNAIYNVSESFIYDIIESYIGKGFNKLTEPCLLGVFTICNKLLNPNIEKLVIIAYSQGTIIMSNILFHLKKLGLDNDIYLKKLEIYTIANCSSNMQYLYVNFPYMEHLVNEHDFVGKLGINCSNELKDYIKIDGKKFIIKNKYGHLLFENYFNNFHLEFKQSKLLKYIKYNE